MARVKRYNKKQVGNVKGGAAHKDMPQQPVGSSPIIGKQDVAIVSAHVAESAGQEKYFTAPENNLDQRQGLALLLKKNVLFLVLLAIPVVIAYANTLSVPFYLDDFSAITNNPAIRLTEINWNSINRFDLRSRPIAYFSFALNYYFHQYQLAGYHLVNIFVHMLTGVFLFFLIRETVSLAPPGKDNGNVSVIAYWATLLWLVNPLGTTAVTYVVQRMTCLAAMFYVLALLIYLRGRLAAGMRRWVCYGFTLLLWLLAIGTKQIAIPLPFFILLYELLFFQKLDAAWFRRNLKYFIGVAVLFALIALIFLGTAPLKAYLAAYKVWDYTPAQRFFTEFRVLVRYLGLLFLPYPDRLVFDYNYPLSSGLFDPISTIFSMATVAALLGAALYLARRQPLFTFAILWYFGNLLLESVWPTSIIFEHKAYLPTMFIFVPLCDWSIRLVNWKRFALAGLLIAALFGLWTYQRNDLWRDPVALWQQSIDKYPGKASTYNGLGDVLFKQGRDEEAIPYFREAVELDPHYSEALNNLGASLGKQGKYAEAIDCFQRAIARKPDYVDALANLGMAYRDSGEIDKAILYFRKTLALDPLNETANEQLPGALKYAEALRERAGGANH